MKELILQYRAGGKGRDAAYAKIYRQYESLIMSILIKGGISNVNIKDTIEYGEALVAFIDAIMRFNVDSGLAFSTFLTHHIRLIMCRHYCGYVCGINKFAENFNDYYSQDEEDWCPAVEEDEQREPAYAYSDRMDKADADLNNRFSPAIAFALKALSGLAGFSKLGKIQIFKLIGTQHREELANIILALHLRRAESYCSEPDSISDSEESEYSMLFSSSAEVITATVPAA